MNEIQKQVNCLKIRLESLAQTYFGPNFCDELKEYWVRHPFVAVALGVIAAFSALPVGIFLCFAAVTVFISVLCFIFIGGSIIVCGGLVLIGIVSFITFITVSLTSAVAIAYWSAQKLHLSLCGHREPGGQPINNLSAETRNQRGPSPQQANDHHGHNVTPDSSTGRNTPADGTENYEVIGTETCEVDAVSCQPNSANGNDHSKTRGHYHQKLSYLLYDVNPGEGFNLRRDVYMRIATLVRNANKEDPNANWVLVLPPWGPLYHWNSRELGYQAQIPWSQFFDLSSLSRYVPVMEFRDFLEEHGPSIDKIYYLQHYAEGWESGHWEEKMDVRKCIDKPPYQKLEDGKYHGWFWGYSETSASDFVCLSAQGRSNTLMPLLRNASYRALMIDRAEVILHDVFGDANYWMVRRSMRFAKKLVEIGNAFRRRYLDSEDVKDGTVISEDWLTDVKEQRTAIGGPYLSVHLRRRDFVRARPKDVPGIQHAAAQLKEKLVAYGLTKLFLSTDAPESEVVELKNLLPEIVRFRPSVAEHEELKDGGVAIIDQWICSHARYFIGTHESTFSFRIQEEREILGFKPETTFNRLCGGNQTVCKQPAQWKIVFL